MRIGEPPATHDRPARPAAVALGAAVVACVVFVAVSASVLDVLPWEYDEGTAIVQARAILGGLRPFVDFPHHQTPLHLYLLAAAGKLFGPTVFGFRMLSVASMALSGLLVFVLAAPFTGAVPALAVEAVLLFSVSELHALNAVPEPPMVALTLVGIVLLFRGQGRWSAWASALAFVLAVLVKPTCLVVVAAAALALACARDWRRLGHFAAGGAVVAALGIAWTAVVSDGIILDLVRFHLHRLGTRDVGMWSIDSGFADMRRLLGIRSRADWTWFCFRIFHFFPATWLALALFAVSFLGIPLWLAGPLGAPQALRAFAVLWPASYLALNLFLLDYVSAKNFLPFLAFEAFLLAGVFAAVVRRVPPRAAAVACAVVCVALALRFRAAVVGRIDPWYYGRVDWITHEYARVVSFTPMVFAASGTEPGCEFENPAITWGGYGDAVLGASERTRRFQFTDARLVDCLRAHPDARLVIDFWYYFFTRPGSPLREYMHGDGSEQALFFSPEALAQWDGTYITNADVYR